uniref:Shieldin complex subunit 2 C-terminal domain-containing protein n=1 Tax=Propithecus coquereli TaxID=379532 RepID=A0A2K6G3R5_PROCO
MLTVEQAQGQHYVLVLWGPGAAWYPQLQRKKDYIWEFKYLFVQRNCILENLELHTTPWSSCECLFDDDIRAITFKAKFQKSAPSFVKMSNLATHFEDKCSETDENRIYKQCFSCLPFTMKRIFYRYLCLLVNKRDIESSVCVSSSSVPSSDVTYGMVAADLVHSLLVVSAEPWLLKIQSLFMLDENSYPLQQDFSLLDFYPDIVKHGAYALL